MTRSMFGGAKEKLLNLKIHGTNCQAWWWGDHGVRLVNCTEQIEKWRRRTTSKLSNFTLNQQLDGWNLNKDGRFNRTCDPRYIINLVSKRVTFSFWLTVSFWNVLPKATASIRLKNCEIHEPELHWPTNLNQLYQFFQEVCSKIQTEWSQKLVDGYKKHVVEVQLDKGHLIKHWGVCIYLSPCEYFSQNNSNARPTVVCIKTR